MIRIAAVALTCVIAPVNFALTQVQDGQLAKQLAAISFKLSDKYFAAITANRRWCPIMGGRWEDHSLPEIVTRDRPSRHFFHESKMMCNGAHIALAILQEIAELPNPHESELFVFTAFVKDLTNLEDFDRPCSPDRPLC